MKVPFSYQKTEFDCGPTSLTNALSFLFDREEIPPEMIRRIMAYCLDGGQTAAHGIYDVPVVDTTAAGDTFTGYFLAGVTDGLPVEQILELASKASSLAVSRKGASDSIPARAEVEACDLAPLG